MHTGLTHLFPQGDKLRWWPIYHEPEHELVGRLQLYINYATCLDENSSLKVYKLLWLDKQSRMLFCSIYNSSFRVMDILIFSELLIVYVNWRLI